MIYRYYANRGGWRIVVLFHKGRKWIRFIDISTFDLYRKPVSTILELEPCELTPNRIARRVRKRRSMCKRLGLGFPSAAVAKTLSTLQGSRS